MTASDLREYRISIRQLQILTTVAEHGSFSRASAVTGVAQSALSRQLLELEKTLRTKLFYRHGRGVSLTEAGTLLISHAESILRAIDHAILEMDNLGSDDIKGTVRLGLPPSLTDMLVVRLISNLKDRYPKINLQIIEGFSGNLLEWLADERLDLCVLYNAANVRSATSQPLWTEDVCFVEARREHQPPPTVRLAEIVGRPLILPGPKHGLRTLLAEACASIGCSLNILLEIDALGAIRDLVEADLGCAIQPQVAVQRLLDRGSVTVRRIVEPELTRTLYLVIPAARALSRASETAAKILRSEMTHLANEGKWGSRAVIQY